MSVFDNQIIALFSYELFRRMASNQPITLFQLNIITDMLVAREIPYDISFVPGTRKTAASLQLTIHVNPTAQAVFVITLEPGAAVFTPSP